MANPYISKKQQLRNDIGVSVRGALISFRVRNKSMYVNKERDEFVEDLLDRIMLTLESRKDVR